MQSAKHIYLYLGGHDVQMEWLKNQAKEVFVTVNNKIASHPKVGKLQWCLAWKILNCWKPTANLPYAYWLWLILRIILFPFVIGSITL